MPTTLTRFFPFSASHAEGAKIYGHNYVLGVTVDAPDRAGETALTEGVRDKLTRHLESRDLSLDVDFLKNVPITDAELLKIFWRRLEGLPVKLRRLTLERDSRTLTAFEP